MVGRAATVCGGATEHSVYTAQCRPSQSREWCSSHLPVEKLSHADWGQFTDWKLPRWGDRQTRQSPLVEATSQPPAHSGLSLTGHVSQDGALLKRPLQSLVTLGPSSSSMLLSGYPWPHPDWLCKVFGSGVANNRKQTGGKPLCCLTIQGCFAKDPGALPRKSQPPGGGYVCRSLPQGTTLTSEHLS